MSKSRLIISLSLAASLVLGSSPALAQGNRPLRPAPESITSAQLDGGMITQDVNQRISPDLNGTTGRQSVVIRLAGLPVAYTYGAGGDRAEQLAAAQAIDVAQNDLIAAASTLDSSSVVLARLNKALNAVILEIDASALSVLAARPDVISINPVRTYELDLSETVPYIGVTQAVRDAGYDGRGVLVAVLDSGIDYTHAKLGGAGTPAAYAQAYCGSPTATPDPRDPACIAASGAPAAAGVFPNAKVVGGFDFVGEAWPLGNRTEDPNPIDFEGHGTHVADIIAGLPITGAGGGVAPAASLLAVKVCSAVSSSCNGIALLKGVEFALDPNNDGDLEDRAKVINMSLGASYGHSYFDDLSAASDGATAANSLVVASAGNNANKPYIVDTPSAAFSVLSVAQTQVPSARQLALRVTAPSTIAGVYTNTATVEWAPFTGDLTGDLAFVGRGCPAGSVSGQPGEDPYLANPAGKIALINRGSCAVSLKVDRAAAAGAIGVIIANNVPGDAPSFSFGGGTQFVPTLVVDQPTGNLLRTAAQAGQTVSVTIALADATPLVGSMVGSSSRGPNLGQMFYGNALQYGQLIKPEIGAPGASLSAVAGSGNGIEAFGGTSGAAPMVSGAAALLINSNPFLSPWELKSRLVNTGETNIYTVPAALGGTLAPITRIGGGEVRVNRAINAGAAAWEQNTRGGTLSFGFVDVARETVVLRRTVVVRNYTNAPINYTIQPTFRYADDAASGVISVSAPSSLNVPARGSRTFRLQLTINASALQEWALNGGPLGANGPALNAFEYDGYLNLVAGAGSANNIHLPWHVLPRLSGDVRANNTRLTFNSTVDGIPAATVSLRNRGAGSAYVDAYSLLGTSPNDAQPLRGSNFAIADLKGVGVASFNASSIPGCGPYLLSFAVSSYLRVSHPNAVAEYDLRLDVNRDGTDDFVVFNADVNALTPGAALDGRSLTWVLNLATSRASASFFTDHGLEASNYVFNVCAAQLGATPPAVGQVVNMTAIGFEVTNTGAATDVINGMAFAVGAERYAGVVNNIAPGATETLTALDFGASGGTDRGLLLTLDSTRVVGGGTVKSGSPDGNDSLLLNR